MPKEPLLPLVEAVREATGRTRDHSTVLGWAKRPNRYGIKLESWIIGNCRNTSVEAVRRYVDASTRAADDETLQAREAAAG